MLRTMPTQPYSTDALIRALAPIDIVIDSFHSSDQNDNPIENDSTTQPPPKTSWSEKSQGNFASLIASIARSNNGNSKDDWSTVSFLPSRRYIHKLVQRYVSRLQQEGHGAELENDHLASLVCYFSMSSKKLGASTSGSFHSSIPDPLASCVVSFRVPVIAPGYGRRQNKFAREDEPPSHDDDHDDLLRIRVYPHHNDVGVAKVWEAGACLAEYILRYPEVVRGRKVVELGAGVGLTGLIAAACAASRGFSGGGGEDHDDDRVLENGDVFVHMTDYTEACMENMVYNVEVNESWLKRRGANPASVTVGTLEWSEYAQTENSMVHSQTAESNPVYGSHGANSIQALSNADVILAADVVYDVHCLPDLVSTVCKFLSSPWETTNGNQNGKEKLAIFATTFRNQTTFGLFEKELDKKGIICDYLSMEDVPFVFPCYFRQPRSDVRLCTMKLKR